MSLKLAALCWELELTHAQFKVLAALADCAEDDGSRCYPGIPYLIWKTGYDERSVRRTLRSLESAGYIEVIEASAGGAGEYTHYRLHFEKVPRKPPYVRHNGGRMPPFRPAAATTGAKRPPDGGILSGKRGQSIPATGANHPVNGGILSEKTGGLPDADAGKPIRSVVNPLINPLTDPVSSPISGKGRDDARAALLAALGTDERAQTPWAEACRHPPKLGALWARAALVPPAHALGSPALVWADAADRDAALLARLATSQARDRLRRAYPDLVTVHLLALADLGNDDNGGDETHGKVARDGGDDGDGNNDAAGLGVGRGPGPGWQGGAAPPGR